MRVRRGAILEHGDPMSAHRVISIPTPQRQTLLDASIARVENIQSNPHPPTANSAPEANVSTVEIHVCIYICDGGRTPLTRPS